MKWILFECYFIIFDWWCSRSADRARSYNFIYFRELSHTMRALTSHYIMLADGERRKERKKEYTAGRSTHGCLGVVVVVIAVVDDDRSINRYT